MKEGLLENFQKFQVPLSPSYLKTFMEFEACLEALNAKSMIFAPKQKPKNLYIYGLTGCGKTTLMNKFFEGVDVPKLNIHFHDYFLDLSKLLAKYSLPTLVSKLKQKTRLLCFDEFFIESIADAKLLNELFERLIKAEITIVLTSNFAPEKLYENGFNRELAFPKFSNFLRENFSVLHLATNFDFRQSKSTHSSLMVLEVPSTFEPNILKFNGHEIHCKTFHHEIIIDYKEAFAKPRSIGEFIYICRNFDKIYISNFKKFTHNNEDEAIRFRNFIDMAYLRNNIVYLQGGFMESDIFSPDLLENIKIKRTYSRLIEMSSREFLSADKILKRKWQTEAKNLLEKL